MSLSIDERIVSMQFDNKQFESGVKTSLNTLQELKNTTDKLGSTKGFSDFNKAANNIDLSSIANSLEFLQDRFSTFGIVGMRIIENLTDTVVGFSKKVVGMVSSGGWSRAMNIEQAKFMLEGLGVAWSDIEEDINYGVQDTAYGLDAAAKAASQLTASGVKLGDEMKSALRGISGVAAMTNASYEEISPIFTTVAGQGQLMTMQLRQLETRGLNAAATLGKQLGKTEAEIREMVHEGQIDFKTFATAMDDAFGQHAKDANKTFTGALSNVRAALSRIGAKFATPIIQGVIDPLNNLRLIINAVNKALDPVAKQFETTVSTMAKAASKFLTAGELPKIVSSMIKSFRNIGEGIYNIIFPIKEAFKDVFPSKTMDDALGLAKRIENLTQLFKNLFDPVKRTGESLEEFRKVGGRIRNLMNTFKGFFAVFDMGFQIISAVFRSIVPFIGKVGDLSDKVLGVSGSFGEWLYNLSKITKENDVFYKGIQKVITKIKELRDKVIEIVGIIKEKAQEVISVIKDLAKIIVSKIEKITGIDIKMPKAEDFTNFIKSIKESWKDMDTSKFDAFISKIKEFGNKFKEKVIELKDHIHSLANSANESSSIFDRIGESISGFQDKVSGLLEKLSGGFEGFGDSFSGFGDKIKEIARDAFGFIGNKVQELLKDMDLVKILDIVNKVFLAKMGLSIAKFTGSLGKDATTIADLLKGVKDSFTNGFKLKVDFGKNLENTFSTLNNSLKTMQKSVDAEVIRKIAISVAILAASLFALSLVNPANLTVALGAVSTLFFDLMKAFKTFSGASGGLDAALMASLSTTLIKMSAAILILSLAISKLTKADPISLILATGAIVLLMEEMARLASKLNSLNANGNLLSVGGMMLLFAMGIKILASAVKKLMTNDIGSLVSGVGAIVVLLYAMVGAAALISKMSAAPDLLVATGAAMIMMASAIDLIAIAIAGLSLIDPKRIWSSVGAIVVLLYAIGSIGAILTHDPTSLLVVATGFIAFGFALQEIAIALAIISALNPDKLASNVLGLVVILVAIVIASKSIMRDNVAEDFAIIAASMIAFGLALQLIAGALAILSLANPDKLVGAVASLVAILGAVAIFSDKAGDPKKLLALGGSLIVMSLGLGMIAGVLLLLGTMSWDSLAVALVGLGLSLGTLVLALLALDKLEINNKTIIGLVTLVSVLPVLAMAMKSMGSMSWGEVIRSLVVLAGAFVILGAAAIILGPVAPVLLLLGGALLLIGVAVGAAGAGLMLIATALMYLASIGADATTALIGSLKQLLVMLISLIPELAIAIGEGLVQILKSLLSHAQEIIPMLFETAVLFITTMCDAILETAPKIVETVVTVVSLLIEAAITLVPQLVEGLLTILDETLSSLAEHSESIAESVVEILMGILTGAINGVSERIGELIDACWTFVINLIDGIADGIEEHTGELRDAFVHLFSAAWDGLLEFFGIHSPSEKGSDMGDNIILGVIEGIKKNIADIPAKIKEGVQKALDSIKEKYESFKDSGRKLVTRIKEGSENTGYQVKSAISGVLTNAYNKAKEKADTFYEVGKNVVTGIVNGIEDFAHKAIDKMKSLAQNMIDKAKEKFDENSPSKVFAEIGKFVVLGLVEGIDHNERSAVVATEEMADSVVKGMQLAMESINNAIDSDFDIDPIITPIVDLTDIQTKAKMINGILSPEASAMAARITSSTMSSARRNVSESSDNIKDNSEINYNFTQNNYSPKALSRIDIYRNTRNQIMQIREVARG